MEKYKIVQTLKQGALGKNVVVIEKHKQQTTKTGRLLIKKVSCIDEQHANDALEEMLPLLKLQHLNISTYKELFITWSSQTSSLFLCLVMRYSKKGSLNDLIETHRDLKKKMDLMLMQKFLGQVLDAVEYLHRMNVIHRNIKPSNIILIDESYCMLEDLSVQTLMLDEAKWNIRAIEDPMHKSWMAPEALEFIFSLKSDIWSLGCIILDMATCSFMNKLEALALRVAIRSHSKKLVKTLEKIRKREIEKANDISDVLIEMLHIKAEDRMSTKDLMKLPFVKDCLLASGKPVVIIKKPLPTSVTETLLQGGLPSVLEVMNCFLDRPEVQVKALEQLLALVDQDKDLPWLLDMVESVTSIILSHQNILEIQMCACKLLYKILSKAFINHPDNVPSEKYVADALLSILRNYPTDEELLSMVCQMLMIISTNEDSMEHLQNIDTFYDINQCLNNFSHNKEISLSCLGLLWSLTVNAALPDKTPLKEAVNLILKILDIYLNDGDRAESACSALWVLSLQGCIEGAEFEHLTLLLLKCIKLHMQKAVLVNNAYQGLASLVRTSELAAFRIVVTDDNSPGISLIKETYQEHRDDPEVVENMCMLLSELVLYDEIVPELLSNSIHEMLLEIETRFTSSEELLKLATKAIKKMNEFLPKIKSEKTRE
ncbi:serine/threonine kinase-like domain-containing protein STKLD1 isoform X1 [Sarcophilus harrisii]|uniref:Serine/threonine kinase-like domain-containing protein STKLD1 n=2 Tax=Sarcophilus harrisii TaxID=9305 RepID=G3VRC2_SARHA|nr:serine/threonine kinase-like domain-containing protein STKLD1 isoform X1 [Sarcophilus harrisii]